MTRCPGTPGGLLSTGNFTRPVCAHRVLHPPRVLWGGGLCIPVLVSLPTVGSGSHTISCLRHAGLPHFSHWSHCNL